MPENLFDSITAIDNLRGAWIKAEQYARTEEIYFDIYAYGIFEEHLEANLAVLRHDLVNGTYHPALLRYISIPKGNQVRKLYFAMPRDCVMMQAVINSIGPLFEAEFSDYSFGNRLNTGSSESHNAYRLWQEQYANYISLLRSFLNEGPDAWYLITDIENYYPSIRLDRLRGLIAAKVHDERVLAIIDQFLNHQAINLNEHEEPVNGLPAGPIYSHFFANIYLNDFDHEVIKHTRKYARYVDDICLVCEDEVRLSTVERLMKEYLGRWGQSFKSEKTERHSVSEWEPLIEHTHKMNYARRLDFVEVLDLRPDQVEAVSNAEGFFHTLYTVAEKEGDVNKLVEEAGYVIRQLKEMKAPNLADVIYSLLDTHPLKPLTLRVALSCLLEVELPNQSPRFRQFLSQRGDDWGYCRIILLQILPYVENTGTLKALLVDEFLTSNYLVRANTYTTLGTLTENRAITLNVEELRLLREQEKSPYALHRLIACYGTISGELIWPPLVSLVASAHPAGTVPKRPLLGQVDRAELRQKLSEYFNKEELRTIAFDLKIEYENFPEFKDVIAREMVAYCERTDRISELIDICQRLRPMVSWKESSVSLNGPAYSATETLPEHIAAVAYALCKLLESKRIEPSKLESIFPAFMSAEELDVESCVHLLYLISRFGSEWMIPKILDKTRQHIDELADELFSIVALEVMEQFTLQNQLESLYRFADMVDQIGLRTRARLGFEEVANRAPDTELRQKAQARSKDASREVSITIGLPEWYVNDPFCTRTLYREHKGDSEYVCYTFYSKTEQREGTLEFISAERIEKGGFLSVDEWIAYLHHLDQKGLISLIDARPYREDKQEKVFCMYEIQKGYRTLAELLQHSNVEGLLAVPAVFDLGLALVQAILITEHNDFHMQSIDPLNVLWSPTTGAVRFLNIGASLGIASYQCGISGCTESSVRNEIGPTVATYYLGLLLLQLMKKECPLRLVAATRARYGHRQKLHDLVDMPGVLPHFRLTLVRLLQSDADYRYSSLKWLGQDLQDIAEFARWLSADRVRDEKDAEWSILRSFVDFRLRIIVRNPDLRFRPPVTRAQYMLQELSKSMELIKSMPSMWRVRIQNKPKFAMLPYGGRTRDLSPEGCRLLGVAEGWEEVVAEPTLDYCHPTPLTKLCLYKILSIETAACLLSSVTASSEISKDDLAEMNKTVIGIMGELKDGTSATFTVRPLTQPSIALKAHFQSDEIQRLQHFIRWLSSDSSLPTSKQIDSLKAVGLFFVLFGFDCELFKDEHLVARSKPVLHLNRKKLDVDNLWQLLNDFFVLDEEIAHFEETCLGKEIGKEGLYMQQAIDAWSRIPETIEYARRLNPGKRWAAELYSYQYQNYYWEGVGKIQLTFPHWGKLEFSSSNVFLSGDLSKQPSSRLPVRVDVWCSDKSRVICSVLGPSVYFRELPLAHRAVSPTRIAGWLQKHHYWRIIVPVLLGLPSAIAWFVSLVSSNTLSSSLFFAGLVNFLGAISINWLSNSIESFLATRNPEDARFVD